MHEEVKVLFKTWYSLELHIAEPFNEGPIKSALSKLLSGLPSHVKSVLCHVPAHKKTIPNMFRHRISQEVSGMISGSGRFSHIVCRSFCDGFGTQTEKLLAISPIKKCSLTQ